MNIGKRDRLREIFQRWQSQPRDQVDTQLAKLGNSTLAFSPTLEHDALVLTALEQAFMAANNGNVGVGAVLFDANGQLLWDHGEATNLIPHIRTDYHAEMVLLSGFEDSRSFKKLADMQAAMKGSTLVTTLEPCIMCAPRIIMSGVTNCLHAAPDDRGGIMQLIGKLPPVWEELRAPKVFAFANCSQILRDIGFQVFLITIMNSGRTDLWPEAVQARDHQQD